MTKEETEAIKSAIMLLTQGVIHEIGTDTAKEIARMLYPKVEAELKKGLK